VPVAPRARRHDRKHMPLWEVRENELVFRQTAPWPEDKNVEALKTELKRQKSALDAIYQELLAYSLGPLATGWK
jgi:hypothetical protein